MKWYIKVIDFVAEKYGNDTNKILLNEMSKYSYSFMKEQRSKGIFLFTKYCKELKKLGFASSVYFYIYYIGLLCFKVRICDKIITILKNIIGHRPQL